MKTQKKNAATAGKKTSDATKSNIKLAAPKAAKRFDDDDDDDDFNGPIDEFGGFDDLDSLDDDDDY